MDYIVKRIDDPSTGMVYYGVFDRHSTRNTVHHKDELQGLIVMLKEKAHANIICDILNEEEKY